MNIIKLLQSKPFEKKDCNRTKNTMESKKRCVVSNRKSKKVQTEGTTNIIVNLFPTVTALLNTSYEKICLIFISFSLILATPGMANAFTWVLHHGGHAPTPTGPNIHGGGKRIQRQNYSPTANIQRWSFVDLKTSRTLVFELQS